MGNLGTFKPKGDRAQGQIALEMYMYFLKTQGQPETAALLDYQHRFFRALLKVDDLDSTKIACITEQAVFLSSLTQDGWYRTAAWVRQWCCRLQFGFRTIYIHQVRLMADDTEFFTLFNKGKDHANNDADLIGPQAAATNTSNSSEDGTWGLEDHDPVTDDEDDDGYPSEEDEEDPTEAIVETEIGTGAQEKINKADGQVEQSDEEEEEDGTHDEQDLGFMRYSRAAVNIPKDMRNEKERIVQ